MSHSLACVYLHLVFATKNRKPFLADKDFRAAVHEYLGGVSKRLGCEPIRVGGYEEHVHLLAKMVRVLPIADWVKELKRASSIWIRRKPGFASFQWQEGYGVFSVGRKEVAKVSFYIGRQDKHHQITGFQEELEDALKEHGIEYDEKNLWE